MMEISPKILKMNGFVGYMYCVLEFRTHKLDYCSKYLVGSENMIEGKLLFKIIIQAPKSFEPDDIRLKLNNYCFQFSGLESRA